MGRHGLAEPVEELFYQPNGAWARVHYFPASGEVYATTGSADSSCSSQSTEHSDGFMEYFLGSGEYKDSNPPEGRRKAPDMSKHVDCGGNLVERFVSKVGTKMEVTSYRDGGYFVRYRPLKHHGTSWDGEVDPDTIQKMLQSQGFEVYEANTTSFIK